MTINIRKVHKCTCLFFLQTHIQANLFGMFRDEKLYPDNDSFKPERWLRENKMDTKLKSLSNLVWGHGARMCIGRRFAEQELHIALTKVGTFVVKKKAFFEQLFSCLTNAFGEGVSTTDSVVRVLFKPFFSFFSFI